MHNSTGVRVSPVAELPRQDGSEGRAFLYDSRGVGSRLALSILHCRRPIRPGAQSRLPPPKYRSCYLLDIQDIPPSDWHEIPGHARI